ncbi:MAG: hypothetical protein LUC97_06210 [Clostridiales bacterium]|nr:hypothetical protein [Clostridiales bacterium]
MAKLEIGTYTHTMYYLKDSTGNFLYNAVFLNEINDEIKQFNGGNYDFRQKFKDSVIFTTVYDAEAVKKSCL